MNGYEVFDKKYDVFGMRPASDSQTGEKYFGKVSVIYPNGAETGHGYRPLGGDYKDMSKVRRGVCEAYNPANPGGVRFHSQFFYSKVRRGIDGDACCEGMLLHPLFDECGESCGKNCEDCANYLNFEAAVAKVTGERMRKIMGARNRTV